VCGCDVEAIVDSDLYLRYVLGEVPLEQLHLLPERHIRCNPALAQYIAEANFPAVACTGPFSKTELDAAYVTIEQQRVSRAWRRLQALPSLGLSLAEYPLMISPDGDAA